MRVKPGGGFFTGAVGNICSAPIFQLFVKVNFLKPRVHDASWLAQVKTQECTRRRFTQITGSMTGSNLKLTCMKRLHMHPQGLTLASQLAAQQEEHSLHDPGTGERVATTKANIKITCTVTQSNATQ
jgi:hypothetical protein